ncbi:MAG: S1 RNA-binding domain-containing protein [Endomicrobia bacterium]|nr:S1 RNA-binding domain-containing protein [Endomicrobiia bacterium]
MFNELKDKFNNKIPIEARVLTKIKNGYIVDIGVDALLPYREISSNIKDKIKEEHTHLKVIIKSIEGTPSKSLNIIVSNRIYEDMLREELRQKTLSHLKEGDEVIGEISSLTNYGAFMDINGVEALLHISNIAWYKLQHPQDVLHIGDKIKVKILSIDKETGKVSVGLKHLFPYPWDGVETRYTIGKVIKGKITNIVNFGLFVELEPGVEGLVHISEVSWDDKNPNVNKMFKVGEEVQVKILEINRAEEKISLSIKKVNQNPWEDLKKEFPAGSVNKGKIVKIVPTGIFVTIKGNFCGFIHISDISWTYKIAELEKMFKIGQYIEYKILDILPEQENAILSIKHLKENPYEKYKVDTIAKCKIKKVFGNLLLVTLEDDVEGVIAKKEALLEQRDFSKDLKAFYRPGQDIEAVVILSDEKKRRIELSIRKLEKIIQKQLIKKYSQHNAPSLKDILIEE